MTDIVERLRSSEPLPACPYDKLSPHYLTAPNDKPCAVCGGLNDPDAPDLCRGADTRIMGEAADKIERLRRDLHFVALWCYRESKITDAERLSAIKYHPSVRAAAKEAGFELTADQREGG